MPTRPCSFAQWMSATAWSTSSNDTSAWPYRRPGASEQKSTSQRLKATLRLPGLCGVRCEVEPTGGERRPISEEDLSDDPLSFEVGDPPLGAPLAISQLLAGEAVGRVRDALEPLVECDSPLRIDVLAVLRAWWLDVTVNRNDRRSIHHFSRHRASQTHPGGPNRSLAPAAGRYKGRLRGPATNTAGPCRSSVTGGAERRPLTFRPWKGRAGVRQALGQGEAPCAVACSGAGRGGSPHRRPCWLWRWR